MSIFEVAAIATPVFGLFGGARCGASQGTVGAIVGAAVGLIIGGSVYPGFFILLAQLPARAAPQFEKWLEDRWHAGWAVGTLIFGYTILSPFVAFFGARAVVTRLVGLVI